MKIYIVAVEALRKKKRPHKTQFTTKIGKKTFVSQSLPFVKFSFPVTRLMPYYAEIGRPRPFIAQQKLVKKGLGPSHYLLQNFHFLFLV
jgi:hypothetical protein